VHAAGGGHAGRIRSAALYSGIALALQAPWAIRNQATLGEPVLFSTLGGFTFWLGNAYYAEHGTHQTFKWTDLGGTAPEIAGLSEPEMDRFYYRKSWAYVREHPGAVLGTYARKLWDLWRPAPHREFYAGSVYWVGLLSSLALYALAAAGTARLGFARPDVRLLLAMILSYSLLAAVHLTFVRHRAAAIDPLLVPLAAAGLDLLCPGRIFLNGRKDPAYDAAPVPRSPE
jgi:hypothetical protein